MPPLAPLLPPRGTQWFGLKRGGVLTRTRGPIKRPLGQWDSRWNVGEYEDGGAGSEEEQTHSVGCSSSGDINRGHNIILDFVCHRGNQTADIIMNVPATAGGGI